MLPSVKMLHEVDSSKVDPGPRQYSETIFHEPVLTHFHHFNIDQVTDLYIFWQELTTVKQTRTCKQSILQKPIRH